MRKMIRFSTLAGLMPISGVALAHVGAHQHTSLFQGFLHLLVQHGYLIVPAIIAGVVLLGRVYRA
ncbi:MAG: hypothetical protein KDI68_04890 [Gammaproteobacteria bacterium]|nr:hypothetical protein [Gammaproteobacteria bacterium]